MVRYGARFITEYVDATVGMGALNVGEYWADAKWSPEGELHYNQDENRQVCRPPNGQVRMLTDRDDHLADAKWLSKGKLDHN